MRMLVIGAIGSVAVAVASVATGAPATLQSDLAAAVAAPSRTPANTARDRYRHPAETLAFFAVKPSDTVVEIWPSGGWYTEILAPYVAGKGTYWGVGPWPKGVDGLRGLQEKDAALYGAIKLAAFPADADMPRVPDGTADVVLTFRNVHNWRMGYQRGGIDYAPDAFRQMFAMLKPGGTLGVVDHRLPENADAARERSSGYVKVSTVRQLAEAAGFVFDGASEVNANPRDTADWPDGVWTLPPSYRLKDVDRAKYAAIGESDRMTLRFRKPR
ncbi:class I SAM-dependent methyltransferase [Sphingomonas sp.]|uniref:class I SAM-dependent methyltransferase n=1 Tax=Sphingomonas sp. TaxID=28214 RepID=UPI002B9F4DFE|nr:methyltransferase domain-containing protein [Sphingomonas sp.]HWK35791.1 methyltransferase domain-containing protein [Sphingomonas sp.]